MSWSPDGSRLASDDRYIVANKLEGGTVVVWDVASGEELLVLEEEGYANTYVVEDINWSSDGSRLAGRKKSGPIVVWNISDGQGIVELEMDTPYSI